MASRGDDLDRTVLPIPEPEVPTFTELDVRNVEMPERFEVRAPEGAPNVVIILLDDFGFGQATTFGGPIPMPTLERLASEGLRYNNFHSTAVCSPTRAALLTGRNHHVNNTGLVMETSTSFPGNTGQRPRSVAAIGEMLRLNGYSTAWFGKDHETPPWTVSVSGPTDLWPVRQGFDRFYGFIAGETNQYFPDVYDGMTRVDPPEDPDYHFMTDMTDQAVSFVRTQQALTPDRPFLIYFAPGATHAPHHVPKEWIDTFNGQFDQGWDKLREETLARQKELGIVPPDTELAPKPEAIKDWDTLSPDEQRLFRRQMEIFAAFAAYADHEIGRVIQAIEEAGAMDNTLVFYIAGDNGASAEGGMVGAFNEAAYFNLAPEPIEEQLERIDELGGPMANNHYAAGWAVAGDAPFTWTKQVGSDYGGVRNGLVVHWPNGITARNEIRTQFHHVIDVLPTVLAAAGLPQPSSVNGVVQTPIQGVSMTYSFDDAEALSNHVTQYFEIAGNRAIYDDGWFARTIHKAPWEMAPRAALADDTWELYDTSKDFSLANDLSAEMPEKLAEMRALFMEEAAKNHVLPIDDRTIERFNAAIAGRPDLMGERTSLTLYEGMSGLQENIFINVRNRSKTITADVVIPNGGANGVIICQGGRPGGWSLYLKDGRPSYVYNWLGQYYYTITADDPLPAGNTIITLDFVYDGGGLGRGGTAIIVVDGHKVAEGRVDRTQPISFWGETADVGIDLASPTTEDYKPGTGSRFTGKINKVTVEVGPLDLTPKDVKKVDQHRAAAADAIE
ncbi:MAG: arylsulfatase [Acidimicrobiia bacterium]